MLRCGRCDCLINFGLENEPRAVICGGSQCRRPGLCDDGLVIDLSRTRSVHVDAVNQTVRVQSGAMLGDLDRERTYSVWRFRAALFRKPVLLV